MVDDVTVAICTVASLGSPKTVNTLTQLRLTGSPLLIRARDDASAAKSKVVCCINPFPSILIVSLKSPAQAVTSFTGSDHPNNPRSQALSPPPPRYLPSFVSSIVVSTPPYQPFISVEFHRIWRTHALGLFGLSIFTQEIVSTTTGMHSVKLQPMAMTAVGTSFAHHSMGDADITRYYNGVDQSSQHYTVAQQQLEPLVQES